MRRRKTPESLAERAKCIRDEAERICEERNNELEDAAREEFVKGEAANFIRRNAKYVTGLLVARLGLAQAGKAFTSLRPFDAETLFRLLTTTPFAVYDCWMADVDQSDEEVDGLDAEDLLVLSGTGFGYTAESTLMDSLIDAFTAYARAAAIYAKHIRSTSLLEWVEILDILNANGNAWMRECFSEENAHRLIELEASAAKRLHLERIAAALPAFHAKKPAKKAKTAKKRSKK